MKDRNTYDIIYIRLSKGFAYLVAMMDWYSRYVVSWEFSASLGADFFILELEKAISLGRPEISISTRDHSLLAGTSRSSFFMKRFL
jgi:hypothetical protein